MFDVALAAPFALGLVAAFNPCGFAMLPTYLAYFMGLEDDSDDKSVAGNIMRGLVVGLTLTLGFVAVFGAFGLVTTNLVSQGFIGEYLPWFTMVIGVLMVPFGIAMLLGYEPNLRLPRMSGGTSSRQLPSVFTFGVSYAVVSLGCTAPTFLIVVAGSFTTDGVAGGMASYVAYAVGMGSVIVFLTMTMAMARGGMARNLRRVLPYVSRVSGGLLVIAGVYLFTYGWWEYRIFRDPIGTPENRFQRLLTDFQIDLQNWILDVGPVRVGLFLVTVIVVTVVASQLYRRLVTDADPEPPDPSGPDSGPSGPGRSDSGAPGPVGLDVAPKSAEAPDPAERRSESV